MWYSTWILGLGLAFVIINVVWSEASDFSGERIGSGRGSASSAAGADRLGFAGFHKEL